MKTAASTTACYDAARERYTEWGVDTDAALVRLANIPLSLHCWQGDDVAGFESIGEPIGGGLAVIGNYPGRARTPEELRRDLQWALAHIPGRHRINLHASYAETQGRLVERNELQVEHFQGWIDWARDRRLGLDFNPTYFAHPLAADGLTLTHPDVGRRQFWIEHGIACRRIGAAMGRALGSACINNVWIPDGSKDIPVDRRGPRERLSASLDAMFVETFPAAELLDAVESKLFGIGSESYVAGSHEFYLGYASSRKKWLCLDTGHFHPTESVADKVSAILPWVPGILLHVSRGVRWDSDHVVTLSDELRMTAEEVVRADVGSRIRIGLDYFDASINRVAAWVIGARATIKALLMALLQPLDAWCAAERAGDFTARLAWQEEFKNMPWGAVWDQYCQQADQAGDATWLTELHEYERQELSRRDAR